MDEDAFSKLANAKSDLELVYRRKDVTGFIVTEMETITICNDEDYNFVFVTEKPAGIIHSN